MRRPPRPPTLRRALLCHVLLAGLVTVVTAAGAATTAWRTSNQQAARTALQVSAAIADAAITSLAAHDFGAPGGYDRADVLDRLQPFLRSGTVYRVKLWIVEGDRARILVSDEARIEGTSRGTDSGPLRSIGSAGQRTFNVPDDVEHRYETTRQDQLLEVFLDFRDEARNVLSLELYVPVGGDAAALQAMTDQLPLLVAGALGIGLATLPLTVAASRRTRRTAERYAVLATLAVTASDRERRELAQRLHDGPIQALSAASVVMSLDTMTLPGVPPADSRTLAHDLVRDSIRQLRTLTDDVVPEPIPAADLAARLPALLRPAVPEPIALDVRVAHHDPGADLNDDHALLVARSARELVRNAVRHGRPARVSVVLDVGDTLRLTVDDNGAGFDPRRGPQPGHVGLTLIAQAVADAGGTLSLRSSPDAGCTATVQLPLPRRPHQGA
ncbi:sensor histidine kinase [Dactylosporangium fulvum]|uniref:ATP-binding protein n=1 Tax=Dactylosporangium fulvum TaxID=53359 RepID=A0ABY5VPJ7_9ACTN|nr:ATP-binding protein [Dactylosporangium fulvum]UWP79682.1 ATP-binding protein [Dactylosporangium fulvum]